MKFKALMKRLGTAFKSGFHETFCKSNQSNT